MVRIEGRLVKSPSFWVRDVDVTWKFMKAGETMVPTELSSSARVRFYGRSNFKMTYDYVQVDGRPVESGLRVAPERALSVTPGERFRRADPSGPDPFRT